MHLRLNYLSRVSIEVARLAFVTKCAKVQIGHPETLLSRQFGAIAPGELVSEEVVRYLAPQSPSWTCAARGPETAFEELTRIRNAKSLVTADPAL